MQLFSSFVVLSSVGLMMAL